MKWVEYLRLALTEIINNKARTFLTLLGIIIGIAAVIIIIFIVQGAEDYVTGEIEKIIPTDIITVYNRYDPQSQRLLGNITLEDIDLIEEKLGENIRAMAPRYWHTSQLEYRGIEREAELIPTTPSFQEIYNLELLQGRFLTSFDVENFKQVIILGHGIAQELFAGEDPVNKKLTLDGFTFTVIGVLPEDYQSPLVPVSFNDNRAFIPITVMERLGGFKDRFTLLIRLKDRSLMPLMLQEIRQLLDNKYGLASDGNSRFVVYDTASDLDVINTIKIVLMVLMGGVASITLLVAGIGVMNIMLVIVAERTKEIGLRKALGATRGDILFQFIIESITLCLSGGVLGIILGYGGSKFVLQLANNFIQLETSVPLWAVFLALIFTTGVGLFFGIYPAFKASRLDPIEALHYE